MSFAKHGVNIMIRYKTNTLPWIIAAAIALIGLMLTACSGGDDGTSDSSESGER
jgi:hypothetical protein